VNQIKSILSRYADALSPNVPWWAYVVAAVIAIGWAGVVSTTWVFLGTAAFITSIAALGLLVLVGWGGEVSLAHAALVGTAVYISGYAMRNDGFGWPFLAAGLLGLVVAVGLSALVSLPTAKLSGIYVMVLTLGLQVTIERTIFTNSKLSGGVESRYVTRPRFLGLSFDSDRAYYYLVLAVLVLTIAALTLFRRSRHGRALMFVGTDRRAAAAMGISPYRYKILAFLIAGGLAGIAGALTTPLYRSPPTSLQYISVQSLFLLAIPVTAGFESLVGVVAVALVFTMTPHAVASIGEVSPLILAGAGLTLGTYIGPGGFSGVLLDLLRSKRESAVLGMARQENRAEVDVESTPLTAVAQEHAR
jgi:branched-chain amino acid transport system permease protein